MAGIRHWENWAVIHDALNDLEYKVYGKGDEETEYIKDVVESFRDVENKHGGERVKTRVFMTHGRPHADFYNPYEQTLQTCEIADLCFDIHIRSTSKQPQRWALISQSKISNTSEEKWTVNMKQHFLLHHLPLFWSDDLGDLPFGGPYRIFDPDDRFTNYSLASKHNQPLFCSTKDIGDQLSSWDYTQGTSTYYHRDNPPQYSTTVGFISKLLNGYTGLDLQRFLDAKHLVDNLIDYAERKDVNPITDGGVIRGNEDEDGLFAVIQVLIEREE